MKKIIIIGLIMVVLGNMVGCALVEELNEASEKAKQEVNIEDDDN